jgi:hypothetical protein
VKLFRSEILLPVVVGFFNFLFHTKNSSNRNLQAFCSCSKCWC